jgi:hypothetical protein
MLTLLLATLVTTAIPGADAGAQAPVCSAEPAPVSADAGCSESPVSTPARPATLTRGRLFHQIRYHLALPASRPRILDSLAADRGAQRRRGRLDRLGLAPPHLHLGRGRAGHALPRHPHRRPGPVDRPASVVASR